MQTPPQTHLKYKITHDVRAQQLKTKGQVNIWKLIISNVGMLCTVSLISCDEAVLDQQQTNSATNSIHHRSSLPIYNPEHFY